MALRIVDTNVAVVANGASNQASDTCVEACIDALAKTRKKHTVVVDSLSLIIEEYRANLSPQGAPGVGDAFFKWLWDHQGDPKRCCRVTITPSGDSFREFPDDPELTALDHSDHKFVAVAIAAPRPPTILNAVDRDWWDLHRILERHGLRVRFLCRKEMLAPRVRAQGEP